MAIHPSRPSIEPKAVGTPITIGSPGLSCAEAARGKLMKTANTNKPEVNNPFFPIILSSFLKVIK
jgi:hypothetical protein